MHRHPLTYCGYNFSVIGKEIPMSPDGTGVYWPSIRRFRPVIQIRSQLHSVSFLWVPASLLLLFACSWFVLMELLLQHPAFEIRAAIAALIVVYAALCLSYSRSSSPSLRHPLTASALGTLALGIYGLLANLRSTHFEGYLLLIALGLIVQSLLTLAQTLPRPQLRPA